MNAEFENAKQLAEELNNQCAEEVAALVDFLKSTQRTHVLFSMPNGSKKWTYEYEAKHKSGYGTYRGVASVFFVRIESGHGPVGLAITGGPTEDYTTATVCRYGELRDKLGGFRPLVAAITAHLRATLEQNSNGRAEALAELSAARAEDDGAAKPIVD